MASIKNWILVKFASFLKLIRGEVPTSVLIKRGMVVGKNFNRLGGENRWFFSVSYKFWR